MDGGGRTAAAAAEAHLWEGGRGPERGPVAPDSRKHRDANTAAAHNTEQRRGANSTATPNVAILPDTAVVPSAKKGCRDLELLAVARVRP